MKWFGLDLLRARRLIALAIVLYACAQNLRSIRAHGLAEWRRAEQRQVSTAARIEYEIATMEAFDRLPAQGRLRYLDTSISAGINPTLFNPFTGEYDDKAAFRLFTAQYALAPRVLVVVGPIDDTSVAVVYDAGRWVVRTPGGR